DIERRVDLVRFAAWLNQGRGILTISRLFVGNYEDHFAAIPKEEQRIQQRLEQEAIIAFSEVEVVPTFEEGVIAVAQANGIAGISSNTIMFGWSEKRERLASTLRIMRVVGRMGKSTLICRVRPRAWTTRPRRIDVWWGGLQHNGDKMLLFAYLLSVNPDWHGAEICVRSVATNEMMQQQTRRSLERMLQESRIDARTEVTIRPDGTSVQDMIQEQSRDADIVFLGLRQPEPGTETDYAQRLEELVGNLPTVVLVRNASQFAGRML
ncbi:MAG: hypothetical protein JXQ27_10995, partial [Acidobacteria bacterium]|nr:hypothetical protein [Acidobacteriota bacterium]